jgi:muramoyltetrapeptide carboxypeptidase
VETTLTLPKTSSDARTVEPLRRGDLVGIAAPASPVPEHQFKEAMSRFKRLGLRVTYREDLFDHYLYLARKDATRAAELTELFLNPEVKAIFCACPGYGSMRLLPLLPWEKIAENPKIFMGFSDITVLLTTINALGGFVTFHGPTVVGGFRPGELAESSWRAFRQVLMQGDAPIEFRLPRAKTLGRGTASGRLVGGNLEMLTSLLGTPWEPDTTDAVLFLEEVGEGEETLDHRLMQLRLSGKLEGVKAIVFGEVEESEFSPPFRFETVVKNVLGDLGIPVLIGFPAGHGRRNVPIVVGGRYAVCVETKTVTQLSAGVRV